MFSYLQFFGCGLFSAEICPVSMYCQKSLKSKTVKKSTINCCLSIRFREACEIFKNYLRSLQPLLSCSFIIRIFEKPEN